jgi:hypothetical protein
MFCNKPTDRWSEEHVIPEWLLDYFNISAQDQTFQGYATSEGTVSERRIYATRRLVDGRVCTPCNTGWMSDLENNVKVPLVNLIERRRTIWELTVEESEVVAKWAVKSAYTLANISLASEPALAEHLWHLSGARGKIPAGVAVFGFQAGYDKAVSFLQIPSWPQVLQAGQSPQPVEGTAGSYKIAWQFGHLILLVAYYSKPAVQLVPVTGLHVPIWPDRLFWPTYANRQLGPFTSSLPTLKSFAESLAVFVPSEESSADERPAS